ncbi:MAG: hypothetical protein IT281_09520 [Ignavibacteria bacterium]|nr:hypothetical protein [Ignavibacteria bacterium]
MKKLISASLFIFVSIAAILTGCSEELITNNPVLSTKGIYVLYEGSFGQPQSYDYGFVNTDSNIVSANVYQNSNGGAALNAYPNGMQLIDGKLFIVSQGNFAQSGTIYKIDAGTNQLISSKNFGTNPYSLVAGRSGLFYVTNTASDYVSVLDNNLNIIADSLKVGFNPSDLVSYGNYIYVAKQSYTFENSLAIINITNNNVQKVFFNTPPVSVETAENRIHVSTYSGKTIYSIAQQNNTIVDSTKLSITEPAIGTIVSLDYRTMFVLGVPDTTFGYNIGKRIYKVDIETKTIDPSFNIIFTGNDDAYGISYNALESRLYVANSKSGAGNGEIRVYDNSGNLVNTFPDIGGKFPKRIVFKTF